MPTSNNTNEVTSQSFSEANTAVESVLNAPWPVPIWLTLVITILLLGSIGWLYRSERGSAGFRLRCALTLIRCALLALVLWMLAGWSWQRFKSDPPELVIVVDRSASMGTRDVAQSGDASQPQSRIDFARSLFEQLSARDRQTLAQRYQLKWLTVADKADPAVVDLQATASPLSALEADGSQSRLGDALNRLIDRQAGRGTAAILFISDGITTSGAALADTAQKARRAAIPIHTVVVGQQFVQPDLRLVDLLIDREVYLGDQVTAEVSVVASDIPNTTTKLTLTDLLTNKVLDVTSVELSPERNQQQARLSFVPDRSGEIPLQISVEGVAGEADLSNNTLQVNVLVQDKAIRVLMVFQTASYEFRFLKSLLERTQQTGETKTASFELQSVLQDADPTYVEQDATALRLVPSGAEGLREIDVFVFSHLDPSLVSRSSQEAIFEAVTTGGAGCIFVYGYGSPAVELQNWPLGKLLPIDVPTGPRGPVVAEPGPFRWDPTPLGTTALPMQLANSPRQSYETWRRVPPVNIKAEVGQIKTGAQVLANAVDMQTTNTSPLLITQFAGAGRTALQATDETHSLTTFAGTDLYYQRYWGQMLRWLSRGKLARGTEKSTLLVDPKQAQLGRPIRLQLLLGSESSGRQTPETAELTLESSEGVRRSIALTRTTQEVPVYQSTVSDLSPGSYRAVLLSPIEAAPPSVEFTVTAPPGEQANLRADQEGMRQLAEYSRGKAYNSDSARSLFEQLPLGKPTRLGNLPPLPLWNSHWIALTFVLLLTAEWLLRRRARML